MSDYKVLIYRGKCRGYDHKEGSFKELISFVQNKYRRPSRVLIYRIPTEAEKRARRQNLAFSRHVSPHLEVWKQRAKKNRFWNK